MQESIDKLKKYTLLFVDDEEDIQQALANILDNLDVEYYMANSAKEALEVLEHHKIDYMITDINMPRVSGLELIEKVQENYKNIEFIILSAHSETPYIKRAKSLNIKGYLIKPIDIIKLINTIVK